MDLVKLSESRKGKLFTYIIKGDGDWSIGDLVPYFKPISDNSNDYKLDDSLLYRNELTITDSSRGGKASINLERTLVPEIKIVKIIDEGIGTTMIHKYMETIPKEK